MSAPNVIQFEHWLAHPVPDVFSFFGDEKNLEAITPPWLNFRVVGKTTERMQSGTLINYRLSLRGIPLKWQSRIEEWEPNKRFVDTQVKGPYKLWYHTHTFEAKDGGTLMSDVVRYAVPGGLLGNVLAGPFVRRDLAKIFAYRKQKIDELFAKK